MRRILATLAIAAATALSLASPASAAPPQPTPVGPDSVLHAHAYTYHFVTDTSTPSNCSTTRWIGGPDAPNVLSNDRRLATRICPIDPGVSSDYAEISTNHSVDMDVDVANVTNLRFDRRIRQDGTDNAGAPRISVGIDTNNDGDSDLKAFLASRYCGHPFGSGGPAQYVKSDFTGFKNNCGFFDSNGVRYDATGTLSAWHVFADAHVGDDVVYEIGVIDEPGPYGLDNFVISNRLYGVGPYKAIFCGHQEYGTVC